MNSKIFAIPLAPIICGYLISGCISISPLSPITQPQSLSNPKPCLKPKPSLPEPIPDNLSLNINEGAITTIDKGGDKFLKNYESLMSSYPELILPNLIFNAHIEIKNDRIIDIDSGGERLIRTYAATRKAIKSEAIK